MGREKTQEPSLESASVDHQDFLRWLNSCLQEYHLLVFGAMWENSGLAGLVQMLTKLSHSEHIRSITDITLYCNDIGGDVASALAPLLYSMPTIQKFTFSNTGIQDDVAQILVNAIKDNRPIRALSFSFNRLTHHGIKMLAEAMTAHQLCSLDISGNNLGHSAAQHIVNIVEHHKNLTQLKIWKCHIGAEGIRAILAAIEDHPNLRELNLGGNNLGVDGASYVAQFLSHNDKLQSLDIRENTIPSAGIELIGSALEEQASLLDIRLGGSSIDIELNAVHAIAYAIKHNTSLRSMHLHAQNEGERSIVRAMTCALEKNIRITDYSGPGQSYSKRNLQNLPTTLMYFAFQLNLLISKAKANLNIPHDIWLLILTKTFMKPSRGYVQGIAQSLSTVLQARHSRQEPEPSMEPVIEPEVDDLLARDPCCIG